MGSSLEQDGEIFGKLLKNPLGQERVLAARQKDEGWTGGDGVGFGGGDSRRPRVEIEKEAERTIEAMQKSS
jgi:hypothetical protein